MNLSNTVAPKSDQLNADDLIAGPRTIRITAVSAGSSEQPVNVSFEGDNNRPWKPSKGMRRVLIALYGPDSSAFIGQRVTLYNDTSVTFGPDTTGGIRISHASGIRTPLEIALTVKKGKRKPFRVEPLPDEKPPASSALTPAEIQEQIFAAENIGPEKAKSGLAALGEWWNTLNPKVKSALAKQKEEWKAAAELAG